MRQFGGSDALPDLTELLDDNEPQVQREAVRAILNVGTDAAYRVLEQALAGGTPQSREAIMQSIGLVRDERATPLFAYILGHIDHRGALAPIYLRAIESLGALRDPGGDRAAARRALQRRVVGAAPDRGAAHGGGVGAGADRHAGGAGRARRGDRGRLARRPLGGARRSSPTSARAGRPAPRTRATHERAALPARRRTAAPPRRVAALGAALFARASDHRAQPRVAVGRVPDAARSAADGHHRPGRRRGRSSTTCRWPGPRRSVRSSAACSRPGSSGSPSTAA